MIRHVSDSLAVRNPPRSGPLRFISGIYFLPSTNTCIPLRHLRFLLFLLYMFIIPVDECVFYRMHRFLHKGLSQRAGLFGLPGCRTLLSLVFVPPTSELRTILRCSINPFSLNLCKCFHRDNLALPSIEFLTLWFNILRIHAYIFTYVSGGLNQQIFPFLSSSFSSIPFLYMPFSLPLSPFPLLWAYTISSCIRFCICLFEPYSVFLT